MSKITPGPWHAVLQDHDSGHKWFDIWSDLGSVAHLSEEARTDEGLTTLRADAQLIAASPDLLAACKAALAWIEAVHEPTCEEGEEREDGTIHDGTSPEGNLLRAAIAKVEGPS